jgi:demethylmenaquinone methyltransferase/2-methoxy-6-polyprenyl-1,4-benzoquinol methylase
MAHLQGKERATYVQNMFDRVAARYQLMNTLMTAGQDQSWRRFVLQQAQLSPGKKMLDLATGPGDIAFEALRSMPGVDVIGADFSMGMMKVGKAQELGSEMGWCCADAMHLPFPDAHFDAVTSGYLVRNVIDIPQTLREQRRVLKPHGRIVILDTTPPPDNLLKPFIEIHLRYIIPLLGRMVVGKEGADAYQYLPSSTQAFKAPEELAELLKAAGFRNVGFKTFMFGTMAVHWGDK